MSKRIMPVSRDIFVTEHAGTPFRKFFPEGRKPEPFYPGTGITNTTPLRPNFGSLFAFRNLFQIKERLPIGI
jgi:hypothetical protein